MPTAVVTGAGSGLGRAIALELGNRGYLVHATDVDADAAAQTASEIGSGARSAALDVRDEAACRALAAEAASGWRGLQLRLLDLFPRLTVRLLPLAMSDARRRQRRYAKRIAAGQWP